MTTSHGTNGRAHPRRGRPGREPKRPRPEGGLVIVVDTEMHRVTNEAVAALPADPDLYRHGDSIVRVSTQPSAGLVSDADVPPAARVVPLTPATLAEHLTSVATWVKRTADGTKPTYPPKWCVRAVYDRVTWPDLRPLRGVVASPVLRGDGVVVQQQGYDAASGWFLAWDGAFPPVSESPTQEDATAAAGRLLELVEEFPFAEVSCRSAWLAGLLTLLARPAFDGPAPLFAFDANAPGAGKGLLANLIAAIALGRKRMPCTPFGPREEMNKHVVAVARSGDRVVFLDNIGGGVTLGGPAIDMALTTTTITGRVLGTSSTARELPLLAVWYATGNNLRLGGDTARRTLLCRIVRQEEHPQERGDYRHPRLLDHAWEHRRALAADALTVLRAYVVAGRPDQRLPAFGAFETWSDLVRGAVHWATGLDPVETCGARRQQDEPTGQLRQLLVAWSELPHAKERGVSVRAALLHLKEEPERFAPLREALMALSECGDQLPTSRAIGDYLSRMKERVVGERCFVAAGTDRNGVALWRASSVG